ncbi:MAG: chemotaxis protein [Cyanobacteriota bacterium]|nr:chemotaxis protein [Cyanobacteriota bacterium]
MPSPSVSFRITRHTEDLAQTIHALSQRVVSLEQRLAQLEDQLTRSTEEELPEEQVISLANVDQLLRDCRELLAADPSAPLQSSSPSGVSRGRGSGPSQNEDGLEDLDEFEDAA